MNLADSEGKEGIEDEEKSEDEERMRRRARKEEERGRRKSDEVLMSRVADNRSKSECHESRA